MIRFVACLLGLLAALTALSEAPGLAYSREPVKNPRDAIATRALADLPIEARRTIQLIRNGGPFPYERDGVMFGNFERALPRHERGYYREYTVPTPGVRHRGGRRIVAGRNGELYYTDDHYRTFQRIRE